MPSTGQQALAGDAHQGGSSHLERHTRRDVFRMLGAAAGASALSVTKTASSAGPARQLAPLTLSETNAVVDTAQGKVRGYTDRGIHTFKGIPYGAATGGSARFMPPQKPVPWTGIRNSLRYGPPCPQYAGRVDGLSQFFFEYERGEADEDCLRLNVWTPGVNQHQRRPVLVWLHGGGFSTGSSFELPSYDGRNLANRGNVVVISVTHRLNAFGFLHLGEYGDRYAGSVNVGMLDIVAALEWVRDHVGSFGGNPGNVTVFGQSGGGAKVNFLMAMPSAKGLFHKAIAQSTTPPIANNRSLNFSAQHAEAVLASLGIKPSALEELQKVSSAALIETFIRTFFRVQFDRDALRQWSRLSSHDFEGIGANPQNLVAVLQDRYGWNQADAQAEVSRFNQRRSADNIGPVADGRTILVAPFVGAPSDLVADVPMLIGHTLNEGGGLYAFSPARELWTDGDVRAELAKSLPPVQSSVLDSLRSVYPTAKPVELYIHATTGLRYRDETLTHARWKVAQQEAPVYVYTFAWKTGVLDGRPRAFHRSEIPFVFDNTDRCAHQTGGTDAARRLAARVSDAWIAFARAGDPNHSGIPKWPRFENTSVPTMIFDNTCAVRNDHDRAARDAFSRG